jgi:hypothetical protein
MVNALRLTLLRDRKETEIDGIYSSIKACEADRGLYQHSVDRTLKNYQAWKLKYKVEGIKY